MKKLLSVILCVSLMLSLCVFAHAENTEYKVGICNWVDDASLNQIVENIMSQLEAIGEEKGVTFDITYQNPNADAAVMNQIIADFIADDVDLMIAIATPVAQAMMGATPDNQIPAVAPFGGYKQSGIGRETDLSILEAYTQQKNIFINLDEGTTGFYPQE